jgi:hypothetical protein
MTLNLRSSYVNVKQITPGTTKSEYTGSETTTNLVQSRKRKKVSLPEIERRIE